MRNQTLHTWGSAHIVRRKGQAARDINEILQKCRGDKMFDLKEEIRNLEAYEHVEDHTSNRNKSKNNSKKNK